MKQSRPGVRVIGNVLLLAGMVVWGVWLLGQAKGVDDYVVDRAAGKPRPPACQWMPLGAPEVATLGWSIESEHAWSDRKVAFVALNAPALPRGAALDLDVIALPGGEAVFSLEDANVRYTISNARQVRIPVQPRATPGPLVVKLVVDDPQPPSGEDRRWLGVAVKQLRLCQ